MKKIYLLLLLQPLALALFAQQNGHPQVPEPVNPQKDKKQFQGYTIQLTPVPGTYGYDIWEGNKIVFRQHENPMPLLSGGLKKKEDVFKVAVWVIKEYKKTGHWTTDVLPHIARELNIQTN